MAALPWAASAGHAAPRDPMRNAAANLALLGAARALTRDAPREEMTHADAEFVVRDALSRMAPETRLEAARKLKATQERVYETILSLQAKEGPVNDEDVRRAFDVMKQR